MTTSLVPTSFETSALLQTEQLGVHKDFGDCEDADDTRPWRALREFSIACPKSGKAKPLQGALDGEGLRFCGVVEPYGQQKAVEKRQCAVKDIGPILVRSFQGYGERKLIVWISTARAHYALADPAPEYRACFEPLQTLADLCASVYLLLSEHSTLSAEELSNRLPHPLKTRFEEFKKQVAQELLAFQFLELSTGAQVDIEGLKAIQEMSKGRKRKLLGAGVGPPSGKARMRAKQESSTDSEVVRAAPSDVRQQHLLEMGFEERQARQAVRATRGESVDAAIGWILAKNLESEVERPASRSSQPSGSTRTPPTPPLTAGKRTPLLRSPDDAAEDSDESSPPLRVNRRRCQSGGLETRSNLPPLRGSLFDSARAPEETRGGEQICGGGSDWQGRIDSGNDTETRLASLSWEKGQASLGDSLPNQSLGFVHQHGRPPKGFRDSSEAIGERKHEAHLDQSCAAEGRLRSDGVTMGLEDNQTPDLTRLVTADVGLVSQNSLPEKQLEVGGALAPMTGKAASLLAGAGERQDAMIGNCRPADLADERGLFPTGHGQNHSDSDNSSEELTPATLQNGIACRVSLQTSDRAGNRDPFAPLRETSETLAQPGRGKNGSQQPGVSRPLADGRIEEEPIRPFAERTEGLGSLGVPANEPPQGNLREGRCEVLADEESAPLAEAERLQHENHTGATLSLLGREVEILIDAFALWWESDQRFYTVRAVGYDVATHRHKVRFFIDGQEEWLALWREEVRLLEEGKDYADVSDIPKLLTKDFRRGKQLGRKVIRNSAPAKGKAKEDEISKAKSVELEAELEDMEADEAATALEDDVGSCHVAAPERPLPLDAWRSAVKNGPQTFHLLFENVLAACKGEAGIDANGGVLEKEKPWDFIQRHLWDIPPETIDSALFSVAHRRRKYVSNIPTEGRFRFGPPPPLTISAMWPEYYAHFPEWDVRKARDKLNMINTKELYPKGLSILNGLLSTGQELNTERKKLIREYNLIFTSPKTVAPLREEEVERIMGFPTGHMRSGRPRKNVFQMLGNSFQVDTIMERLSPLREYYRSVPGGISVISLFDGIGGLLVAFWRLDIPIKRYISVEIDEDCRNVVRNFWTHRRLDENGRLDFVHDIRDLTTARIAQIVEESPVDFIGGGSPCNQLTGNNRCPSGTAGGRSGLLGRDSRLFLEFPRVLNEVERLQMRRGRGSVLDVVGNN